MTWRQQYDRTYQIRNSRGTLCFLKTDSSDIAEDVRQMGRRRVVWVWSHAKAQYEIKESTCSASQPSKL